MTKNKEYEEFNKSLHELFDNYKGYGKSLTKKQITCLTILKVFSEKNSNYIIVDREKYETLLGFLLGESCIIIIMILSVFFSSIGW